MGKDQSSGKLSETSGVDRLLGRQGHSPYLRLLLEELWVASLGFSHRRQAAPLQEKDRLEKLFRSVGACPRRSEVVRSVRLHARRMDLSRQERYRVHRGAYRITYEIQDDVLTVVVMKVGRRSDVYQGN